MPTGELAPALDLLKATRDQPDRRELCVEVLGAAGSVVLPELRAAAFTEIVEDPRTIEADVTLRARTELLGQRYYSGHEWLARLSAVTPDQVSQAISDGLRTAQLVIPEPYTLELSDLDGKPIAPGGCVRTTIAPDGKAFRPPMRARMLNGAARRARLILTPTAVDSAVDPALRYPRTELISFE